MARFLCLAVLFAIPLVCFGEEETYLLFDVKIEGYREKPPVWLALRRPRLGRSSHFKIEQHLVRISPGKYRIAHVDFHESQKFSYGTLRFDRLSQRAFLIKEGYVNYLGTINIEKVKSQPFKVVFSAEESLVSQGCLLAPEVFAKRKVVVPLMGDGVEYSVDCNRLASE